MSAPLFLSNPASEGLRPSLTGVIDETARLDIESGRIACADILVARHGMVVYYKQHGAADRESGRPLEPHMLFRLASMTKPVIAAAVLLQQERGLLSVDDPLHKYIPAFEHMSVSEYTPETGLTGTHPAARPILLRDLLTHSSGLGSGAYYESQSALYDPRRAGTLEKGVAEFAKTLLEYDPGSASSYSGFMAFDTLAHVVELTSGMEIGDFLKKNFFDPLGMENTGFAMSDEQKKRAVRIHETVNGRAVPVDMAENLFSGSFDTYHSGGGGLFGCASDYFRFAQMLLQSGEYEGARILRPETVRAMAAEQVSHTLPGLRDDGWSWGFGVRTILRDNGSQRPLPTGAFGWSGALGTHFWVDPRNELAVVYMSNMTTAGGSGAETAREIERDVYAAL